MSKVQPSFDAYDVKGSVEKSIRSFGQDLLDSLPEKPEGHTRTISIEACDIKIMARKHVGRVTLILDIQEDDTSK